MRFLRALMSAGIALLLGTACDQAAPTASSLEPAFNFTNGPASPGPVVLRAEGRRLFAVFNDPDRDLLSVHGLDPDNFLLCGTGTSGFGEVDLQVVDTPSEVEGLFRLFTERTAEVTIFDTGEFPRSLAEFCALFAGPLRIAKGLEDFLATSNDLGGDNHSRTFRFVGELEAVDGSKIRYTEVQKFVSGLGFVVEDIFLRPVGGS